MAESQRPNGRPVVSLKHVEDELLRAPVSCSSPRPIEGLDSRHALLSEPPGRCHRMALRGGRPAVRESMFPRTCLRSTASRVPPGWLPCSAWAFLKRRRTTNEASTNQRRRGRGDGLGTGGSRRVYAGSRGRNWLVSSWHLVGKETDCLSRRSSELDVRIFLRLQSGLVRDVEEGSLVAFGAQPPAAAIAQHSIKNHHPWPIDDGSGCPLGQSPQERLVVDVVQASTLDWLVRWLVRIRLVTRASPRTPAVAAHRAGELAYTFRKHPE